MFRTMDGGKSWQKVLYVDDGTGATDLVINRTNPNILYAAMYEKHRMPWQLVLGGPGTGLYRSDDGGVKWQKLGGGLPTGNLGRIGIDIYQKNPNILYAVVENVNRADAGDGRGDRRLPDGAGARTWRQRTTHSPIGPATGRRRSAAAGPRPRRRGAQSATRSSAATTAARRGGRRTATTSTSPAARRRTRSISSRSTPAIRITSSSRAIRCTRAATAARRGRARTTAASSAASSATSGRSGGTRGSEAHHARQRRRRQRLVRRRPHGDGVPQQAARRGLRDRRRHGRSVQRLRRPAGSRLVEGPVERPVRPDHARSLDDGRARRRHVQPGRSDRLALGLQHARDGQSRPLRSDDRPAHGDRAAGAAGRDAALQLGRADRAVAAQPADRSTRARSSCIDRSTAATRGKTISPDLTVNEPGKAGRNSGSVPYATITSISESPLRAGADLGRDRRRQGAGDAESRRAAGRDATPALVAAGAPVDWAVSRVFASPHDAATAFVSKSGFRHDDFRPQLFRTTDAGKIVDADQRQSAATSRSTSSSRIARTATCSIVGTDLAVHVSIDGGASWSRLKANLPTVAFHDLTIHPRENDLVLGTYGRAIWVGDITPLQDLTPETLDKTAHLFDVEPRARYGFGAIGNYFLRGNSYSRRAERARRDRHQLLREGRRRRRGARVTVADAGGRVVATLTGPARRGLNRVQWSLGGGGGRAVVAGLAAAARRRPGRRRRVRRHARGRRRENEQAGEHSRADQVSDVSSAPSRRSWWSSTRRGCGG